MFSTGEFAGRGGPWNDARTFSSTPSGNMTCRPCKIFPAANATPSKSKLIELSVLKAVEVVGAGFEDGVDDGAGGSPQLRIVVAQRNVHRLQCLDRRFLQNSDLNARSLFN